MRCCALCILVFLIAFVQLTAQCTPPMAETCEETSVLCSLDELNGYACNNPSTIPSPCSPLCSQGGVGHNTSWWGFVSRGGKATITLTVGGCTTTQGMEYGIWGDCMCGDEVICRSVPCIPQNTVSTINVDLKPCKTYYLWIDGCHGDICDFTLSTQGDSSPTLQPLPKINNDTDRILGPLCEGQCNAKFFVNSQPGLCEPTYVWTLDGNEVGANDTIVSLDFPDEGNFVICVTAYIGNPNSGSICSQEGPQCATVLVRKPKPNYKLKTVCWEFLNNPKGDTNCVYYPSGRYRCVYVDSNCCKTIDTGDVIVLPFPDPADVYYITCDNEPYIDLLGRPWDPCKNQYSIMLTKTTDPFKCDSSINLTAVTIEFYPRWRVQCIGGQVELSPNISIIKPCSVGETYEFEYRWYNKNDGAKKTISTDERLLVDTVSEDYCLEVNVKVQLETEFALCTKTFCERFNEDDLVPKAFPLVGDLPFCIGENGFYWIDTFIAQKVNFFSWTIDGGFITSRVDSQAVEVKWLLPAGDTGLVCAFYDTDCGKSPEKCIKVPILASPAPDAGPNDSICGKAYKFQGKKDVGGNWTQIGGPGNSNFIDVTDPTSDVFVDAYGVYKFVYSETRLACTSSDTVELFFNSTPDSSGLTFTCNVKQTQYKLRFLVKGGTPPYIVVQGNGTVDANNFYSSDFFDSNTDHTILIRDAMACILTFNFNHECKCTNAVGAFPVVPENKCEDQSFTLFPPANVIPNPNDTLIYVLTTDPDINNVAGGNFFILLRSMTIEFNAAYMNYGSTYYIFVLLGKKNGNGGIDFIAGCVQADGPKPFIFYQNPIPNAGPDDSICGTLYDLNGIQSVNGSQIKWKLVGGTGLTINDDIIATTQVNTNGQYGTFVFELTEDNNTCVASDKVSIAFNLTPFISTLEKICFGSPVSQQRYIAVVNIQNGTPPYQILQGNGIINGNIYVTDTLQNLEKFTVEIQDANGCISNLLIDDYYCDCGATNAGILDSTLYIFCADQCTSIKNLVSETLDPEEIALYIFHQSSWNETDPAFPKLDTFYSINDIVCFDSTKLLPGKTYYITRVVGKRLMNTNIIDPKDPCKRNSNNQPMIWYSYPVIHAGRDFKQRELVAKLNASEIQFGSGSWRILSGPGTVYYEDPTNPKTRLRVDAYGKYCFLWSVNFLGCFSYDTVCVEFYKTKIINPDSPKKVFDDRNDFLKKEKYFPNEIFTPSLISKSGNSYVIMYGELKDAINYHWLDIYGKTILNESILIEQGVQRMNINSPMQQGFYFFILEINGIPFVKKVSVIE